MIQPTVGRVVWYRQVGSLELEQWSEQPMAATVAFVYSDRMVNLSVTDHAGQQHAVTSVPLVQEGDPKPLGSYCEWMPYQKGQAAKTEQAERSALELGAAARAAGPEVQY